MEIKLPFNECAKCTGLECCPAVEVLDDGYGSPAPPDCCPNGMEIVKKRRDKIKNKKKNDV